MKSTGGKKSSLFFPLGDRSYSSFLSVRMSVGRISRSGDAPVRYVLTESSGTFTGRRWSHCGSRRSQYKGRTSWAPVSSRRYGRTRRPCVPCSSRRCSRTTRRWPLTPTCLPSCGSAGHWFGRSTRGIWEGREISRPTDRGGCRGSSDLPFSLRSDGPSPSPSS